MTREQLIEFRKKATIELMSARTQGIPDADILAALRSGNKAQRMYADFLENDIMKGENYLPENVSINSKSGG